MSEFVLSPRLAKTGRLAAPLAALFLSACTTTTPYLGKSLFSSAPPSPSARILSALNGGIVGTLQAGLSENDTKRALEAEYRTLEAAPAGQPVVWRGDDANGEVLAAAPYQVGTQNCRQYTHRIIASGKQMQSRGSACRNEDGSWSLL